MVVTRAVSSLIYVYAVHLGLFESNNVCKILEHLPLIIKQDKS